MLGSEFCYDLFGWPRLASLNLLKTFGNCGTRLGKLSVIHRSVLSELSPLVIDD